MSVEDSTYESHPTQNEEPTVEEQSQTGYDSISSQQPISQSAVFKLVEHSVSSISLNCGYKFATKASIDILTDVCCDYIQKITSTLRTVCDTSDLRNAECDFADELDRVFHQINVPSIANLYEFISRMNAIKKHMANIKQQAQEAEFLNETTSSRQ